MHCSLRWQPVIFPPVVAAGCGGLEPEELSLPERAVQAAGPVGVAALQHPLRPGVQDHLHLRHELRRVSARRADMPATGKATKQRHFFPCYGIVVVQTGKSQFVQIKSEK